MSTPSDPRDNVPLDPEVAPITQPFQQAPGEGMTTPPIPPTPSQYPGYPADYQPSAPPAATASAPPPTTPRRGGAAGAIAATVVVLVALIGGGTYVLGRNGSGPLANLSPTATVAATATPTALPTAIPTPTAPAGYQYFAAPDGSYRLIYPVGWIPLQQTANGVNSVVFASGLDNPNVFIVYPSPQKVLPSDYPAFLQKVLTSLPTQVKISDVKLSSTTTTVTLGKNTWTSDAGTLMVEGKPYNGVVLGTDHGTGTFLVAYAAPTATFATTEQQNFVPMATSITFLP